MKKVFGLYNDAWIYTDVVEDTAIEQVKYLCDQEIYKNSRIIIMPDVHAGAGCTIGTTMTMSSNAISPNLVGVDIGCGMYVVELGKIDIDLEKLDNLIHTEIPSGMNVRDVAYCQLELSRLRAPIKDKNYIERSLGTLGGGNHFIEVDVDEEGNKYLVIHSGSRHLGVEVCKYYQSIADSVDYYYHPDKLIAKLKAEGRQKEIQSALIEYKSKCTAKGYIDGQNYLDYINDMKFTQAYANHNRRVMSKIIIEGMNWTVLDEWETIHNYINMDDLVLRKGAVSARAGEKLIIPMNMRDGSLICIGKGNEDWNCSAPHGAGRVMSRTKAFANLSVDEFTKQMEGIYTTTANQSTLDESPMAYKDMKDIIDNIGPTVDIIKTIKPIYNFKAGE